MWGYAVPLVCYPSFKPCFYRVFLYLKQRKMKSFLLPPFFLRDNLVKVHSPKELAKADW